MQFRYALIFIKKKITLRKITMILIIYYSRPDPEVFKLCRQESIPAAPRFYNRREKRIGFTVFFIYCL